jgi:hypothetical protein
MAVASHPLRITERDVIKEQSVDEWFNSFKGLDLHIRVGTGWRGMCALVRDSNSGTVHETTRDWLGSHWLRVCAWGGG